MENQPAANSLPHPMSETNEKRNRITTLAEAREDFLGLLQSDKTARAYSTALNHFDRFLEQTYSIEVSSSPSSATTAMLSGFIEYVKAYEDDSGRRLSKVSQRHYINGAKQFMNHLVYRELASEVNTARLDLIMKREAPEPATRRKVNVDIEAGHLPTRQQEGQIVTGVSFWRQLGRFGRAQARQDVASPGPDPDDLAL